MTHRLVRDDVPIGDGWLRHLEVERHQRGFINRTAHDDVCALAPDKKIEAVLDAAFLEAAELDPASPVVARTAVILPPVCINGAIIETAAKAVVLRPHGASRYVAEHARGPVLDIATPYDVRRVPFGHAKLRGRRIELLRGKSIVLVVIMSRAGTAYTAIYRHAASTSLPALARHLDICHKDVNPRYDRELASGEFPIRWSYGTAAQRRAVRQNAFAKASKVLSPEGRDVLAQVEAIHSGSTTTSHRISAAQLADAPINFDSEGEPATRTLYRVRDAVIRPALNSYAGKAGAAGCGKPATAIFADGVSP